MGETKGIHPYRHFKNLYITAALSFVLMFSLEDFSKENNEQSASPFLISTEQEVITMEQVKQELKAQNILCNKEVLAQIKIESANFTSALFRRTNNMLGMRYAFKRSSIASGIYIPDLDTIIYGTRDQLRKYNRTANYAVYNSWKDGIADFKMWQEECFNVTDRYLEFIGLTYAKDPSYVQKIRQVVAIQAIKQQQKGMNKSD